MDADTIDRLAAEWPESYRGGGLDHPRLEHVPIARAWQSAERCLADDAPAVAAYWLGFIAAAERAAAQA